MITRRFRWLMSVGVVLAALLLLASTATAAETVHLYLKVNGTDVFGDSTQISMGRENSIECVQFDQSLQAPENAGGKATYGPITCVKLMDRATPYLIKAMILGEPVSGVFKFFRPNPTGDGTTELFYTIQITDARITSYHAYVPDTLNPTTTNLPPMEQITFTYRAVTWTFVPTDTHVTAKVGAEEKEASDRTGYGLRAEDQGKGWVRLKWDQPKTDKGRITGYDLYRSTDPVYIISEQNRVLDFPTDKLTAQDRAAPGTYYYVVQAILDDGTRLQPSPAVKLVVK